MDRSDGTGFELSLLVVVVVVVLSRANTNAKTNERTNERTGNLPNERTTNYDELNKEHKKKSATSSPILLLPPYTPTTRLLQFFPATLGTISPYP